jgi:WD40 repeat protein
MLASQAVCGGPPKVDARPRTDRYGDPLPAAAIARLGTVRLRNGNGVTALAFSPDGKIVAAKDFDGQISLWDFATGRELRRLRIVESVFNEPLAFSPDGKFLASPTRKGKFLSLYDVATGAEARKLKLEGRWVPALAFSPDGKFLAWADENRAVVLWDIQAAKEYRRYTEFGGVIAYLAFTPDSKSLIVGNREKWLRDRGEVGQLDLTTGKVVRRFEVGYVDADHIALAPNGERLAAITQDGSLHLWNLISGEEIWQRKDKDGNGAAIAFAPKGESLAATLWNQGKQSCLLKILDAARGRELLSTPLPTFTETLVFSPDGKAIAVGDKDHRVRLLAATTGRELPRGGGHQARINSIVFLGNGEQVATASDDGSIRLWESATGKELRRLAGDGGRNCQVSSFDGEHLLLMDQPSTIRLWDVAAGKELRRVKVPGVSNWERNFSSAGDMPVVNTEQHCIQIWNVTTGETHRHVDLQERSSPEMTLSPDGRMLALVTFERQKSSRLWHLDTGKVYPLTGANRLWSYFVFSCDGRTLAYDGEEEIHLVETATGKTRGWLRRETDIMGSASAHLYRFAFSPDGRLLASTDWKGTIHLWDAATGHELSGTPGHRGRVSALAFSADGKRLATGGWDSTVLIWDVSRMLPAEEPARPATTEELESLWSTLASENARSAYRAIRALHAAGSPAVRFLADRLRPPEPPKEYKDIARFLADLDSDDFATREAATRQLEKLGPWAESHLRAKLKERPSLEARKRLERLLVRLDDQEKRELQQESLQKLRALEALEHIGSAEARAVIEKLAKSAADAQLMREAKASLARLARRSRAVAK